MAFGASMTVGYQWRSPIRISETDGAEHTTAIKVFGLFFDELEQERLEHT